MRRWLHHLTLIGVLAGSWWGMMAMHEAGHVLHAWWSGGEVERVVVPLIGFSRTDVRPNPAPRFVAWGGPLWGCLIPLGLWGVWRAGRWRGKRVVQFFAGFCLVTNAGYLGAGVVFPASDARDLVNLDVSGWTLGCAGAAGLAAGLWLWHRLGPHFGLTPDPHGPASKI